jgi:hypothetical protein
MGKERCIDGFGGESRGIETTWKTPSVWGNIEMDIIVTECEGINWIALAKYRDKWQALVNMAMNLRVPQNMGTLIN